MQYTYDRDLLKVTAQLPPLGPGDRQNWSLVDLDRYRVLDNANWDQDSFTVHFRVPNWDATSPRHLSVTGTIDGVTTSYALYVTANPDPNWCNGVALDPTGQCGLCFWSTPLACRKRNRASAPHGDPGLDAIGRSLGTCTLGLDEPSREAWIKLTAKASALCCIWALVQPAWAATFGTRGRDLFPCPGWLS